MSEWRLSVVLTTVKENPVSQLCKNSCTMSSVWEKKEEEEEGREGGIEKEMVVERRKVSRWIRESNGLGTV